MVYCKTCFAEVDETSEDECGECYGFDSPKLIKPSKPKKWTPYGRAEEFERLYSDKKLFPPDKEGITWERVKMPFKPYPPSQGV